MRGSALVCVLLCPVVAHAADVPLTLEYVSQYIHQDVISDHLMHAVEVSPERVVVASSGGLTLIDLRQLPVEGTTHYISRLDGLNARDLYVKDANTLFVNLHRGETQTSPGFAAVSLSGTTMRHLCTVDEPGVLFEKMCVRGNLLYVTAHAYGLRIYDVTDPAAPVLRGSLTDGFVDAFAVDVAGDTAYVADGAGGLKWVDISDPAHPVVLGGETLASASGTAEDVRVKDGRVYVAAGGAGLATYTSLDPIVRVNTIVGTCTESLGWIDGYLIAGSFDGVDILRVDGVETPVVIASELTGRRNGAFAALRLCEGVAGASAHRVLSTDYRMLDVYRFLPVSQVAQPDISASTQRIRFPAAGGTSTFTMWNNGTRDLHMSNAATSSPAYTTPFRPQTLSPGESVTVTITYDGSPQDGQELFRVQSDDPDEGDYPVQLFGNTPYLDPGDAVPDFTLPLLTRNHDTGAFAESLVTFSDLRGRVVWLQVYASW